MKYSLKKKLQGFFRIFFQSFRKTIEKGDIALKILGKSVDLFLGYLAVVIKDCLKDIPNIADLSPISKKKMKAYTAWNESKYGDFSGLHFPVFGLNKEIYSINLHIQSEYMKTRSRKSYVFEHFKRNAT